MDAEELDQYNYALLTAIAFNNPKQLKKWKTSAGDIDSINDDWSIPVEERIADKLKQISKDFFKMDLSYAKANPTAAMNFAKHTGRPMLFMNPDGFLFDSETNLVKEYTPETIIIKINYDGTFMQ